MRITHLSRKDTDFYKLGRSLRRVYLNESFSKKVVGRRHYRRQTISSKKHFSLKHQMAAGKDTANDFIVFHKLQFCVTREGRSPCAPLSRFAFYQVTALELYVHKKILAHAMFGSRIKTH